MFKEKMPSPEEMERLKKQNIAYHQGMEELHAMKSMGEQDKEDAREAITEKVVENFEKQQGKEKNKLTDEISKRADEASEKIKQRVNGRLIPKLILDGDRAEYELLRLRNDFYHLEKNPDDDCGGGAYDGWKPEEIRELYFVLYGEELQ